MTKRITVSLPDDVAARLDQESNASAYVTDAVRARMNRETTAELLAAHGFEITEEGKARARAKLEAARAAWPPERFAALRQTLSDPSAS